MKVVLINPPIETNYRNWYSLGIGYITAILCQRGIEVEVIDLIGEALSRKEFIDRLESVNTRYFGIGGIMTAFNNVIDIAGYIRKKYPDSFVFAGNFVAYTIPEIILNTTTINAVVDGEGEETVYELLLALEEKRDIAQVKGIIFKDELGNIITSEARPAINDLDKLPLPAWHLMPLDNYFKYAKQRYCLVSTTRGCPYRCNFCAKTFKDYKVRFRSAESVMSELLEFDKRYNISVFHFFDDISMVKKKFVLEFCELKMRSKLASTPWSLAARVDLMDDDIAKALKQANCNSCGFGIESFDQEVLDALNKGVTIAQIEKAIAICDKYGLNYSSSNFMIGAINETVESVRKSSEFAKKHNIRYEPHYITPFPGTKLYEYALREGLITDEIEYLKRLSRQGNTDFMLVNLTKNFSDEELERLRSKYLFFPETKQLPLPLDVLIKKGISALKSEGLLKTLKKVIRQMAGKNYYQGSFNRYSNDWK